MKEKQHGNFSRIDREEDVKTLKKRRRRLEEKEEEKGEKEVLTREVDSVDEVDGGEEKQCDRDKGLALLPHSQAIRGDTRGITAGISGMYSLRVQLTSNFGKSSITIRFNSPQNFASVGLYVTIKCFPMG